jgi:hypothetical protein
MNELQVQLRPVKNLIAEPNLFATNCLRLLVDSRQRRSIRQNV